MGELDLSIKKISTPCVGNLERAIRDERLKRNILAILGGLYIIPGLRDGLKPVLLNTDHD